MSRDIVTVVYSFSELSEKAKAKVLEHDRVMAGEFFNEDVESLYDDINAIAQILGITIDTYPIQTPKLMGGKTRSRLSIWWQLHVQGAGASFDGRYEYAPGAPAKIREYAPTDTVLHGIADGLEQINTDAGTFIAPISARISDAHRSRMSHELSRAIEVYDFNGDEVDEADINTAVVSELRDFMRWIYKLIDDEYTSRTSDAALIDSLNNQSDREFFADGKEYRA